MMVVSAPLNRAGICGAGKFESHQKYIALPYSYVSTAATTGRCRVKASRYRFCRLTFDEDPMVFVMVLAKAGSKIHRVFKGLPQSLTIEWE